MTSGHLSASVSPVTFNAGQAIEDLRTSLAMLATELADICEELIQETHYDTPQGESADQ